MAKQLQLRRGTTSENDNFLGAEGEVTVDTQLKQLRLHDGSTLGGTIIGSTSTGGGEPTTPTTPDTISDTLLGTAFIKDWSTVGTQAIFVFPADITINFSNIIWHIGTAPTADFVVDVLLDYPANGEPPIPQQVATFLFKAGKNNAILEMFDGFTADQDSSVQVGSAIYFSTSSLDATLADVAVSMLYKSTNGTTAPPAAGRISDSDWANGTPPARYTDPASLDAPFQFGLKNDSAYQGNLLWRWYQEPIKGVEGSAWVNDATKSSDNDLATSVREGRTVYLDSTFVEYPAGYSQATYQYELEATDDNGESYVFSFYVVQQKPSE